MSPIGDAQPVVPGASSESRATWGGQRLRLLRFSNIGSSTSESVQRLIRA